MSDKVDTSPLKSSESSAVNEPVPKANTFNNSHLTGTSSCLIDMTINTTSNTIVEQDDDIMSLLDRSIVRRPSVDITDMGTLRQATDAAEKRRRKGYDADGANVGSFNETNPPPGKEFDSFQKGCIRINWKGISRRILDRVFSQILPAGDTKSLKDLLDAGMISVDEIQIEHLSYTLLHWCCSRGQMEMVELLLKYGADVKLIDLKGRTAKILAKENEHDDIVNLLSQQKH